MRAATLEDHRAGTREVRLPGLRGRHRAACAVTSDPARLRRPEPARHDPGRQVRRPSAADGQSAAFAREGVELDVSTLADWVGGCVAALDPILAELRRHVLAAERLHVDDTTMEKVLAKTKTRTGRLWVYLRDDRPFGGQGPPAALYDYSPTRHGEYPRKILVAWSGVMQADAFSGYNALYEKGRKPAPVVEAACWAHGRRDFFDLAKLAKAPIAAEIVRRIDELFAIERTINGKSSDERRAIRQERSKPLVAALEGYMRKQLEHALSPKNDVAKAIRYLLTRWPSFTRFLDDGRESPFPTTPPNAPCAAWRSGAATGPSPAQTKGAGAHSSGLFADRDLQAQ